MPIGNPRWPPPPSWISDWHKKQKICRGISNDHSWAVWFQFEIKDPNFEIIIQISVQSVIVRKITRKKLFVLFLVVINKNFK
jgi:hypothetical protein